VTVLTDDQKIQCVANALKDWESGNTPCPEDAGLLNVFVKPHADCDGDTAGKCPVCWAKAIANFLCDAKVSASPHALTVEQRILSEFTDRFKKLADEILGQVDAEYLPWVETDLVMNERQRVIAALTSQWNQPNRDDFIISSSEARELRARIFEENRDAIIAELNQDSLKKIEELEQTIKIIEKREDDLRRSRYGY
jgi:hypothetical protein